MGGVCLPITYLQEGTLRMAQRGLSLCPGCRHDVRGLMTDPAEAVTCPECGASMLIPVVRENWLRRYDTRVEESPLIPYEGDESTLCAMHQGE